MVVTVELSLYPLDQDYRNIVENFILQFKEQNDFEIITNGMSTTVIGEINSVMPALQTHFSYYLEKNEGIFVMKLGKGELKTENLPSTLK